MRLNKLPKKVTYLTLLIVLSMGVCNITSSLNINIFVKYYGLLVSLQAGFALIYLKFYRPRHR
jgi:hypothetical protein